MKDDRLSGPGIEGRTAGQGGERHQLGIGDMFARVFIRITDINQSGALGNQRPGFGRGYGGDSHRILTGNRAFSAC